MGRAGLLGRRSGGALAEEKEGGGGCCTSRQLLNPPLVVEWRRVASTPICWKDIKRAKRWEAAWSEGRGEGKKGGWESIMVGEGGEAAD